MPDAPRVVDASPLIVLARIGRLELLGTAIVLPAAVVAEVLVGPEDDAARRAIESGRFPPGEFVEVSLPRGRGRFSVSRSRTRITGTSG